MSDNKKKVGTPDRVKINKNEPYEISHEAKKLGTSNVKIHEAIEKVGTNRKKVEAYVKDSQKKSK